MASYARFIFPLHDADSFFERLKTVVRKFTAHTSFPRVSSFMIDDKRMRLEYGREDYYFYFVWADDTIVAEEMPEITQHLFKNRPEKDLIASYKFRIEFWGEDDDNMDYFNEFLFLMETIQASEEVVIVDYQTGHFFDAF
jgi:hypothetical protein